MRKLKMLFACILVMVLMLALAAPALADTGDNPVMPQDFFTWASLLTYAGAVLATTLVTQLLKGVGFIDRIPTRVFAYIVALIILIAATYFTGGFNGESIALCFVNAVVVALAANGAFDAIASAKKT